MECAKSGKETEICSRESSSIDEIDTRAIKNKHSMLLPGVAWNSNEVVKKVYMIKQNHID